MRLYELENNSGITVEKIVNDSKPYFEMVGYNPNYIPVRDLKSAHVDDVAYIKTPESRDSLASHSKYSSVISQKLLSDYMDTIGAASRFKHAVMTSSLGKNSMYNLVEKTMGYVIPVGSFKFSYIDDDFNKSRYPYRFYESIRHFSTPLANAILRSDEFDIYEEYLNTFEDIMKSSKLPSLYSNLKKYYNEIEDKLDEETSDWMDAKVGTVGEALDDLLPHLRYSIHNDNLPKAFETEHEIWFNCIGYYYIPLKSQEYYRLRKYLQTFKTSNNQG